MRQQNIKRLIREEVRRAVRFEIGRAMKRFKIVLETDETADTEPAPPDDLTEIPPDSGPQEDDGIDPGSVAVS